MPLKLLYPKEITQKLKETYHQALHLKAYIEDETFTLPIKFKRLSEKEIEANFTQVQHWIASLKLSSFDIVFQTIAYRSLGEQSIPKSLTIDRDTLLKHLSKQTLFKRHMLLIEKSLYRFPSLKPLLAKKPKLILEYDEVWEKLLAVCDYLVVHPNSTMYIRELEIEGVDTKFIESHKKILDMLLSTLLDRPPIPLAKNGFEKRYGLKYDLPTIRFRILDKTDYISGLSDLSVPLNTFINLKLSCNKVFITENKINGLSFPNIQNAIVIFGLGYGVESLKEVAWLRDKRLYYWGDIDTHGFAILSQIRSYFPHIDSILMDSQTIQQHYKMATKEPLTKRFLGALNYLTQKEQQVFTDLKENIYGERFRLEQERISMKSVKKILENL